MKWPWTRAPQGQTTGGVRPPRDIEARMLAETFRPPTLPPAPQRVVAWCQLCGQREANRDAMLANRTFANLLVAEGCAVLCAPCMARVEHLREQQNRRMEATMLEEMAATLRQWKADSLGDFLRGTPPEATP